MALGSQKVRALTSAGRMPYRHLLRKQACHPRHIHEGFSATAGKLGFHAYRQVKETEYSSKYTSDRRGNYLSAGCSTVRVDGSIVALETCGDRARTENKDIIT